MTGDPRRIVLPQAVYEAMLAHLKSGLPEEACGLLGGWLEEDGDAARAERVQAVENALHSTSRFRMDPAAQLGAFQALEAEGLELVAIFHSHPNGPTHPSPTDLAEFYYPGVLVLITSFAGERADTRAFAMEEKTFRQVALEIVPDATGQGQRG